jgi:hypothetical protein
MKDILFKILFPSKHEEIIHLRTKSKLQGEHIQVLASKSIKQGRKIKDLEVLLNKIKEKETSFLKKKTQEAQKFQQTTPHLFVTGGVFCY